MTRYFKNKKMLRKKEIIKYIFILLVVYYTLKFSVYILNSTSILHLIFKQNKINALTNYISDNTFNDPVNFLNIKSNQNNQLLVNPVFNENMKEEIVKPRVYIYNSHPLESFLENNKTIYDFSFVFKDVLNKNNVDVDVEQGDINNFLIINNLDYGYSYIASRNFIENNIINNNYDLIIDLHRDAISHDDSYVTFNNISYAKIMFVVGALNENYEENYALAETLSNLINEKYPYLSRGVLLKKGPNVNGLYNQDLSSKMILLELGGNNNYEEEVINTLNIISPIIGEYLYGNKSI